MTIEIVEMDLITSGVKNARTTKVGVEQELLVRDSVTGGTVDLDRLRAAFTDSAYSPADQSRSGRDRGPMRGSPPAPSVTRVSDGAQVWTLQRDGREHRVEATGSGSHHVRWFVDGEAVAEKKAWEEKLTLDGAGTGTVLVRFSTLGKPRRATLFGPEEDAQALAGLGGVDLVPEPGSAAAAYEERVRLHPTRYAAVATAGGVAKVVVPLLLGLVAVRFAVDLPWPDLPFPDLPDIPRPDIPWPDIPWPDVPWPDVPWPDLRLPDWVRWLLDKAKYVWPVVLAYILARAEINRRRKQDELRRGTEEQDGRSS